MRRLKTETSNHASEYMLVVYKSPKRSDYAPEKIRGTIRRFAKPPTDVTYFNGWCYLVRMRERDVYPSPGQ